MSHHVSPFAGLRPNASNSMLTIFTEGIAFWRQTAARPGPGNLPDFREPDCRRAKNA
jgi:hypothetical protein